MLFSCNFRYFFAATFVAANVLSIAAEANTLTNVNITLKQALSGTYYVQSQITEATHANLLVDTGSSYTILDQSLINELTSHGLAHYKHDITGVMADGSKRTAQVYVVKQLRVGECRITNIDVVAFDSNATFVLGINALKRLSPFSIDISNNTLIASCRVTDTIINTPIARD